MQRSHKESVRIEKRFHGSERAGHADRRLKSQQNGHLCDSNHAVCGSLNEERMSALLRFIEAFRGQNQYYKLAFSQGFAHRPWNDEQPVSGKIRA